MGVRGGEAPPRQGVRGFWLCPPTASGLWLYSNLDRTLGAHEILNFVAGFAVCVGGQAATAHSKVCASEELTFREPRKLKTHDALHKVEFQAVGLRAASQ